PVPGFNEAFVPDRNFGSYVDLLLMGKLSRGHWVAFNAVPTTAHTMWCLLALALSYWLIDVKKFQTWARFFCYVGMNSLFIYLFTETGGAQWLARIVQPFTAGIFGRMGDLTAAIATSLVV